MDQPGIIPSFHRPDLINYWLKQITGSELSGFTNEQKIAAFRNPFEPTLGLDPTIAQRILDLKRKIILRPLPEDHPNFPNAVAFKATMGLPDETGASGPLGQQLSEMVLYVDNDGDGIPDSVWVDIGLPIQTDASGRRYRPLVAILCQDLDGRLTSNSHSNYSHNDDSVR